MAESAKKEDQKVDDTTSSNSNTMKAIICTSYGDPKDVLKLMNVPKPEPKPKEILIEIYSAALNPVDYKMVKGWLSLALKKKFPWIPGRDFAGRVAKIGAKVNQNSLKQRGIEIGTFVCGMISHFPNDGTLAEYICITPEYCQPFNTQKFSLNEAAALPLAGMTAYQAIMKKAAFKSGGKVLILGGSSGCGVYAIQIAKAYGATEVAVTSSQEAFCKSLGADIVLNYKDKNIPIWYEKLKDENYNVIFDCVGGKDSWDNAHQVLAKNGTFVTIVGDAKHGEASSAGQLIGTAASVVNRKFWSIWGNPYYVNFLMNPVGGLQELIKVVENGKMKVILDDTSPYKLENFLLMFEKQMSHTAHGKLVLEFKTYDPKIEKEQDDVKDPNDENNKAEEKDKHVEENKNENDNKVENEQDKNENNEETEKPNDDANEVEKDADALKSSDDVDKDKVENNEEQT
eukprot:57616_1